MKLLFLLIIFLVAILIFLISLIKIKNRKNIDYVISIMISFLFILFILYFPKVTNDLIGEFYIIRAIVIGILLVLFGIVLFKIIDIIMKDGKVEDLKISGIMLSVILIIYNFLLGMNLYISISSLEKLGILVLIKTVIENIVFIYGINSILSESKVKIPNLNICFSISLILGAITGEFQNKIAYIILYEIILGMIIYVVFSKLLKIVSKKDFKGIFFGAIAIIISYILVLS